MGGEAGDIVPRRLPCVGRRELAGDVRLTEIVHHELVRSRVTGGMRVEFLRQALDDLDRRFAARPFAVRRILQKIRLILMLCQFRGI